MQNEQKSTERNSPIALGNSKKDSELEVGFKGTVP